MLFINKLFNSIACLLSFTNLQLVIPGRTWILLYLGRTVYKRLWACLALYVDPLDNAESFVHGYEAFHKSKHPENREYESSSEGSFNLSDISLEDINNID